MFVVEFQVDSPILQEALAHAPETAVSYEEQYLSDDDIVLLFWGEGGDLATFEEGLTKDPTVTDPVQLTETQSRRLYRVIFTERGENAATFPSWSDLDLSLLDSTATHQGWDVRMRMPDRATLHQYHEECEQNNLQFRLKAIYEESEAATKAESQLTDSQQEALLTARELGYFAIPREALLADVANQCGISSQATSERLRRGTATLIDTALTPEAI